MQEKMEKLGFSKHEAMVYLALFDVGPATTAPIIKKCGLHRNIVYEALDKLLAKKLVSESSKSGKKYFTPLDPNRILKAEKDKVILAEHLVRNLSLKLNREKQQIIIYEGEEEYRQFQMDKLKEMPDGGTIHVIGVSGQWYQAMGEEVFARHDKERVRRKIKTKLIYYKQQYEAEQSGSRQRELVERVVIPENLETPANVVIWHDSIGIQLYSGVITLIEIKSKDIVSSYLNYFNLLWKLGNKQP